MSRRTAAWLAWSLCTVSLALAALGFLFLALSLSRPSVSIFDQWLENAVVAVCFSVVGAVITPRLPLKNPIGWFFCAIGFVGGARLFSAQYAAFSLSAERCSPLMCRCGCVLVLRDSVKGSAIRYRGRP